MKNKIEPILIVGVGRSGTSLLQAMLNAHSKIAFTPETHFIRTYLSKNLNFDDCKDKILNDKYLNNLNLDLKKNLLNSNSKLQFYNNILKEYRFNKSKQYIGDKDPKNIEYLKIINKNFPNCLIIHIIRDPRAVISSRIKAKWSKNRYLWQHILAYKAQFNFFEKNKHIFDNRYVEIKYEKLLEEPKKQLEKILKKLNLNYEKNMIRFSKTANEIVKKDEKLWKNNLFNPVIIRNISKWKYEMNLVDISIIEKCLFKEMQKCGYDYRSKSKIIALFFSFLSILYQIKYCK